LHTAIVLVQVVPHAPQFFGSFERSTHAPLHVPLPSPQAHDPPEHTSPAAHAFAHAPQFAGSLEVSMQDCPHCVRPVLQPAAHRPRSHTWFAAHVVPHAPQFFGSVRRFEQTPPHCASF
jgi:hypothetical protein